MLGALHFAGDTQTATSAVVRLGDVAIVVVASLVAYWLRHGTFDLPESYLVALILGAALTAQYFHLARLYELDNLLRLTTQLGRLLASWLAVIVTLLAIAFVTKTSQQYSRTFILLWVPLTFLGFLTLRIVVAIALTRLRDHGELTCNVVLFGAGEYGQRLARHLRDSREANLRIVGIFDRRHTRVPDEIAGVPVLGGVEELMAFVRDNRVDEIIIALPWRAGGNLLELAQTLKSVPVDVKWCPETLAFEMPVRQLSMVADVPMITVFERPIHGWNRIAKAIEDRVGAVLILVAFSPLWALIVLAVRLDSPGPALFRQKRYGFNNNEITVLKFRTMRAVPDDENVPQAQRDDPRVTRVGRFLRRSSLDEMPQIFNVLRGEMSLIGPRPHAVAHNIKYQALIDQYLSRHRVKPGITGWAQVNGLRGETTTAEHMRRRVEHDLYYIDNWSLLFDLRILALTLLVGFVSKNAY